jgi:TonB family protein
MHPTIRLLALAALLLSTSAQAAGNSVTRQWEKKAAETVASLEKGDYRAAMKTAEWVLDDMLDKMGPGEGSTRTFAIALMQKALASAGLGKQEDALWDWHIALSLHPALRRADLGKFGEAGKLLLANLEVPRGDLSRMETEPRPGMTLPKPIRQPRPQIPRGASQVPTHGKLILEVLITEEGKVTAPMIVQPLPAPTLSYAALQALRRWEFEPATIDGKPVGVIFSSEFSYKIPGRAQ